MLNPVAVGTEGPNALEKRGSMRSDLVRRTHTRTHAHATVQVSGDFACMQPVAQGVAVPVRSDRCTMMGRMV